MPVALSLAAALSDAGQDWSPEPSRQSREFRSPSLARILVVDDEPSVRRMLKRLLSEQGYAVVEAGDGSEALEIVIRDESGLDLVITDVKMPVMSGKELGRLLKVTLPGLPVLYISAYAADGAIVPADPGSPAPFLRKPFEPDDLILKVSMMLRGRRS